MGPRLRKNRLRPHSPARRAFAQPSLLEVNRMPVPPIMAPLPRISGESVAHGRVTLPDDVPAGHYGVIMTYRGQW